MVSCNLTEKLFDDVTLNELKNQPALIKNCLMKGGLLSGYNNVVEHFPLSTFNLGIPMRETCLHQVNDTYCRAVLSTSILSASHRAPAVNTESVMA